MDSCYSFGLELQNIRSVHVREFKGATPKRHCPLCCLEALRGVLIDVSTVCMKSFNDIWENAGDAEDMLAMSGWLECGTKIVNNELIMALKPHTPYIARLQDPCTTLEEMKGHSAFGEWRRHFDDLGMGLIADIIEYAAILWIMADCLVYDKEVRCYVEQHVRALPTFTWTHNFLCLPEPHQDGKDTWQIGFLVKQCWKYAPVFFKDAPKAFESICDRVNVFKVSTIFATDWEKPMAWHLGNRTTMWRVLQHATDPATVMQATLDGTCPNPLPNNAVVSDEPRDATLLRPFAACEHEPRVGACANLHREANADFKVDANFNRTRNS